MKRAAFLLVFIACTPIGASFSHAVHVPLPPAFRATAVAIADMNADGTNDIVLTGESQQLLILLGDGKGNFRQGARAAAGVQPSAFAIADLDGDGLRDVVIANHDTDHLTLLFGTKQGAFTKREIRVHSVPHPHTIAVADTDNDKRPDLIFDSWGENRLMIVRGAGSWSAPAVPVEVGRKPYWNCVSADLNADGKPDLIAPNAGLGTVSILLGQGNNQFRHAPGSPMAAGPGPFTIATGDFDGDGDLDIAVANYSGQLTDTANDGLTWIRNDGAGRFTPFPQRVVAGTYSARLATGNINRDRYADVAFANSASHTVTIVYGSASGPKTSENVETMNGPHAVALGDLNGDGRADLVVTSEDVGEVWVHFAR